MKNYDENAFVGVLLLCLVALFCSCSTSRRSVETINVESRDSLHGELHVDTISVSSTHREDAADTVIQTVCSEGTLEITRDSAGRPIFYRWAAMDRGLFLSNSMWNVAGELHGGRASAGVSASTNSQTDSRKKESTVAKAGLSLTDYVGAGMLIAVVLYVLYVIVENLWRNRKK